MDWEVLATLTAGRVRRAGRFVAVDLDTPHRVISTSARTGGEATGIRLLVNHQSCEGAGHEARAHLMIDEGPERYHDRVCAEIGAAPETTAVMGTAANMHYAAVARERDDDVEAVAVVTAGVHSNATCAGDPARWRETPGGVVRAGAVAGTINSMLIVSRALTAPALARAVMTMTEAKSAALARLAIPSGASRDLATGTGTDQYCAAAPIDGGGLPPLTSTSPHMKLGEIIGAAVRRATIEALRWQNGLEASYTRGLVHALGRYGVTEAALMTAVAPHLDATALELLRRNQRAVLMEPLVTAAAYAMASVIDRVRYGTLPASVAADALVQQAASLAVSLAAAPARWSEFRAALHAAVRADAAAVAAAGPLTGDALDPLPLVAAALALGWREKWPAP